MQNAPKKEVEGLDGFVWFRGVVEDRNDPEMLGRVRVRCLGYHTSKLSDIPKELLPWSYVAQPTTSASMNGIAGETPLGPVEGTWVIGFFADGTNAQYPIVTGTLPGKPKEESDVNRGFADPNQSEELRDRPRKLSSREFDVEKKEFTITEEGTSSKDRLPTGSGRPARFPRKTHPFGCVVGESDVNRLARGHDGLSSLSSPQENDLFQAQEDAANEVIEAAGEIENDEQQQVLNEAADKARSRAEKDFLNTFTIIGQKKEIAVTGVPIAKQIDFEFRKTSQTDEYFVYKCKDLTSALSGPGSSGPGSDDDPYTHTPPSNLVPFDTPIKKDKEVVTEGFLIFESNEEITQNLTSREGKVIPPATSWDEITSQYCAKYPYNRVFESESGHVLEFDDTPEFERLHLFHRTGSSLEYHPDGTLSSKVVGDKYESVLRNIYEQVSDSKYSTINRSLKLLVNSDGLSDSKSSSYNFDIEVGGNTDSGNVGHLNFLTNSGNIAMQTVEGDIVMATGKESGDINMMTKKGSIYTHTQSQTVVVDDGGDLNVVVRGGGNVKINVQGNVIANVDGDMCMEVGGNTNIKTGGDYRHRVGGNYSVVCENGGEMTFVAGYINENPTNKAAIISAGTSGSGSGSL